MYSGPSQPFIYMMVSLKSFCGLLLVDRKWKPCTCASFPKNQSFSPSNILSASKALSASEYKSSTSIAVGQAEVLSSSVSAALWSCDDMVACTNGFEEVGRM